MTNNLKKKFLSFFILTLLLNANITFAINNPVIDSLYKNAQLAYQTNYIKASQLATLSKEASIKANYIYGVVQSSCLLSLIQSQTNKSIAATDTLQSLNHSNHYSIPQERLIYQSLGSCWFFRGDLDSAFYYFNKSYNLFPTKNNTAEYATINLHLAEVMTKQGVPTKALEYHNIAVTIIKNLKSNELLARSNDILACIYLRQQLNKKSLQVIQFSIKYFEKTGNLNMLVPVLIHAGNNYYKLFKDDSARIFYNKALNHALQLGDIRNQAICLSNLSRIYLEHGKVKQSLNTAHKAISMLQTGSYPEIEAGTYQQLGDIYGEMGNISEAIRSVQKALVLSKNNNIRMIERDCLKSLSELYAANKNYKPAFENLLFAYRLKDSLQPVFFTAKLAEMEAQFEAEKKEATIQLLTQKAKIAQLTLSEQENNLKKQQLLLFAAVSLIIAILTTLYFYLRWRKQTEKIKRNEAIMLTEEHERQRIAKDIHDELGSGLTKIKFLSEFMEMKTKDEQPLRETLQSITDTSHQLIDNMRDMIWNMNPSNATLDNLAARIRECSSEYLEDFPIDLSFKIADELPSLKINIEASRNILMILKEALQNIVKHSQANHVSIRIDLQPSFKLIISDNGIGIPQENISNGNGLKNMQARAAAIGAVLQIESTPTNGTHLLLDVKLNIPI